MNNHTLADALRQLLMAANPGMWGTLQVWNPSATRRYIAGKIDESWNPNKTAHKLAVEPDVVEPPLNEIDALVKLQDAVRALPKVFTEDEVPEPLRFALARMEQMGIIRCTSKRRAEIKQYLRVGV